MKLLIIGHSHTTSLVYAATAMGIEHQVIRLGGDTDLTSLRREIASAISALKGSQVDEANIAQAIGDGSVRTLVTVGGNFHNVVGMLKHSQPYDFCVPDFDHLPLAPDYQIIDYDVMRDFLYGQMRRFFLTMLDIKRVLGDSMVHIDSPPPLEDNALIRDNIDQYFKNLFPNGMPDINPPVIRFKHWYLAQTLYKTFCKEAGITYLENKIPRYRRYYLNKLYFGGDATHANAEFAKDYIRSVAKMRSLNNAQKHAV